MLLTISIVNWNTKKFLEKCLKSIYGNTKLSDFEVIVVDNASEDGSTIMIKEKFPQIKLIANSKNLGFGKAHNQVIKNCQSKYILILNSDVIILDEAIDKMIEFMEKNDDSDVVTCKVLNKDGSIQLFVNHIPFLFKEMLIRIPYFNKYFMYKRVNYNKFQRIENFNGSCYIARKIAFNKVGLFDESFFAYAEETDLFLRMKKKNMKIYYLPEAEIIHYGGASTTDWTKKNLMHYTNLLKFYKKKNGILGVWLFKIIVTLSSLFALLWYPIIKLLPDSDYKKEQFKKVNMAGELIKISFK